MSHVVSWKPGGALVNLSGMSVGINNPLKIIIIAAKPAMNSVLYFPNDTKGNDVNSSNYPRLKFTLNKLYSSRVAFCIIFTDDLHLLS